MTACTPAPRCMWETCPSTPLRTRSLRWGAHRARWAECTAACNSQGAGWLAAAQLIGRLLLLPSCRISAPALPLPSPAPSPHRPCTPVPRQVFSKVGDIKRIVMGLDKHKLTPCGFCFVVYYTREDTEDCCKVRRGQTGGKVQAVAAQQ